MLVGGDDSMTPDDSWNELQTVSMGPLPSDLNMLPRIPSPFEFSLPPILTAACAFSMYRPITTIPERGS